MEGVAGWSMPVLDLTGARPDEVEAHIAAVRRRLSHHRLAPGVWPLFSVEVRRCAGGAGRLHLGVDGLITDGYGLTLLLGQWAAACGGSPASLVLTVFASSLARAGARPPFSLIVTTSARIRLPAPAAGIVGPFTSSAILVADPTLGSPVTEAARAMHEQLWGAL